MLPKGGQAASFNPKYPMSHSIVARGHGLGLRTSITICGILCWLITVRPLHSQGPSTDTDASSEAGLRRAERDYLAALDRGDRRAIAESWTAEGTYLDANGQTWNARELVQKMFTGDKPIRPLTHTTDVKTRLLTDGVAIEEGRCALLGADRSDGGGRSAESGGADGSFVAVWMKQDGKWRLAKLIEVTGGGAAANSSNGRQKLSQLEPLIGHWSGSADKLSMQITARWNSDKTFLRRDVTASQDGKKVFEGTQEIGWDPISQSIKSWNFNSDGGHSEGIWDLDGTSWIVVTTGVLPNGQPSSNTQLFKFRGRDSLEWKRTASRLGSQTLPDLAISLRRQSDAP